VVGDGGAERILLLGSNPERTALGQEFGATDVGRERGEEAVERVRELTQHGAHSVLECVGLEQAVETALAIARPGGAIGRVGVPERETTPTGVGSRRTLQSPAALHPSAPISRRCCPTCSKVGSSPDVSSTAPDRSKTCRTATAR
jgi:threonine dehydrogenase-like Zn-dependent dehydrogenase